MGANGTVQAGLVFSPAWRDPRRPLAWMDDALCAQGAPDLWFADGGRRAEARKLCARCPVKEPCGSRISDLEMDQHDRSRYGTFGSGGGRARAVARAGTRTRPGGGERPERNARIVRLSKDGWDAGSIADDVGCTERTVYRVLRRAREES